MEREQMPSKRFRKAMFGFRKADVMNYIDWLESDMAAQLSAAQEQIASLSSDCQALGQQSQQLESERAILAAERDRLVAQAVEAAEKIDFLEASRLACTQRLSASERQNAALQETLTAEQARAATAEEELARQQEAAEQLRLELAQQRVTLRAQTEACLELLAEVQEMADELQDLGRDRVEQATGQSIACLSGIEEAMCALLDRISAWQNEITDIRILMENGDDGMAEAFTARLAVMRERADSLRSGAISRLRASTQEDAPQPAAEAAEPVSQPSAAREAQPTREPRRTAYTVRTERAERRSRLLRLLEGWLGE